MLHMPSGIYPEVAFPRIVVIAQTPGLAVKDVEVAVTRPIEEAVSIVLGVTRVRSKSVRGAAEVSIDFAPGTDMVQALNDVRARMAEVGSQLPAGTSTITERQTPSVFPIISFVVTGGRDPSALHDYAYYDLRPRISRIPDVSYVTVQGGDVREILVEVEPESAGGRGLVDRRGGRPPRQGTPAEGRRAAGPRDAAVPGAGQHARPVDPLDLENLVIAREERPADPRPRPGPGGDLRTRTARWPIRSNGKDAVALTVFRRLGGNALTVSRELQSRPGRRRRRPPRRASTSCPSTTRRRSCARRSPTSATRSSSAACFSVLILLVFLKSIRATLIASLAIPLSLIISFVFLHLTGDTLNLMSLGGLAVAIGLIIDDSVVVVENIARHLAEGQTGRRGRRSREPAKSAAR